MLKVGAVFGPLVYKGSSTHKTNRKYAFQCGFCGTTQEVWGKTLLALRTEPNCSVCVLETMKTYVFCDSHSVYVYRAVKVSHAYYKLPPGDYRIYLQELEGPAKRLGTHELLLNGPDWANNPSYIQWSFAVKQGFDPDTLI